MSTIKRDKSPKGEGLSPTFQIRIPSEFKEQLSELAKDEGMSLGNWFKDLARKELQSRGIKPKG
ncbi:TPA: ribbon-helix-helix protein, CopG family [Proteus mirabilis]|nr:ribbon-helix-helix protein, CopG family [Proteus mirabilis]MCL8608309.1 toxin-antitoxin system HicB family antitoxin [Proteus mirabilis]MCT7282853.1 toxin-antitoxin system HicB family antitoxin [Proteus mirabilis]